MSGSTANPTDGGLDIVVQMVGILATCLAGIIGLILLQTPTAKAQSSFFPNASSEPSKHFYETFVLHYSAVWMGIFGVVVITQAYELFSPIMYILFFVFLCLPFVLQPLIYPGPADGARPWHQRYATKANVWIAVYSFIGNYWYTHYFYSVLKAAYTLPGAIRLNNVPICMFLATHAYFSSYHLLSNCLLRKVVTTFERTIQRDVLFVAVIGVLAYFTAFMETFTISSFPYYVFEDRNMAYVVGSAFYGIYFIVSFPAFYFFDNQIDQANPTVTIWDTIVQSCGYGMIILILLDLTRLLVDVPLVVGATAIP